MSDEANELRAASVTAEAHTRRERTAYRALLMAAEDAIKRGGTRPAAITVLGCRVLLEPPAADENARMEALLADPNYRRAALMAKEEPAAGAGEGEAPV